jgi:hypothetical protein
MHSGDERRYRKQRRRAPSNTTSGLKRTTCGLSQFTGIHAGGVLGDLHIHIIVSQKYFCQTASEGASHVSAHVALLPYCTWWYTLLRFGQTQCTLRSPYSMSFWFNIYY